MQLARKVDHIYIIVVIEIRQFPPEFDQFYLLAQVLALLELHCSRWPTAMNVVYSMDSRSLLVQ